ncbi:hypothetical protein [Niabella drilacis]|nr:hypothetical protein [Niabella drilacis]
MKPGNPKRTLTVKSDIYEAYDALFTYSWTARYDGFSDFETFQELKKYDH